MLITSLWLALRPGDETVHSPRSLASPERQSGEAENRMPDRERKAEQRKGRGETLIRGQGSEGQVSGMCR